MATHRRAGLASETLSAPCVELRKQHHRVASVRLVDLAEKRVCNKTTRSLPGRKQRAERSGVVALHRRNVSDRLRSGRRANLADQFRAGVVRGEGQLDVASESLEE